MISTKSTFSVIFISLVIDLLAFTVILPLMPTILDFYAKNDSSGLYSWLENKVELSQKLMGSPTHFNRVLFGGLIGSWFSLLQYISNPIMGSLSDIYGRRPIMIISLIGISISYSFWALSGHFFTLFIISRTIGGLSKGNISLSTAVITDVSTESNRGKGMALIGISFSVGFIIGPILGAMFAVWSRSSDSIDLFQFLPAMFALTLSILNVIFVWFSFEETFPVKQRALSIGSGLVQAYHYISPISLFSFRPVNNIKDKDLLVLKRGSWVYFLFLYLYSGLEFTLTFLTHLRFNYTSMQQGKLYLFAGLIMTVIQGSYVRRIEPGNELKTVISGILAVIPSFIVMGIASNPYQLYFGLFFYAYSSATVVPCLTTIISSYGPPDQKGVILGIFRSIGALARALGPVSASLVFWRFGPTVCYCLGGISLVLPLIMSVHLKKIMQKSN